MKPRVGNRVGLLADARDLRQLADAGTLVLVGVGGEDIEQELRAMYRAGVKQFGSLERAWAPLAGSLSHWFETHLGCG